MLQQPEREDKLKHLLDALKRYAVRARNEDLLKWISELEPRPDLDLEAVIVRAKCCPEWPYVCDASCAPRQKHSMG